jgi:hypothetical protein
MRERLSAKKREHAEFIVRFNELRDAKEENDSANIRAIDGLREQLAAMTSDRDSLLRFSEIRDTVVEADRIRTEATLSRKNRGCLPASRGICYFRGPLPSSNMRA